MGKKKAAIKWDSRCQQDFDDLKTLCTTASILAYANFSKLFKLHTDACGMGLGAVLYQTRQDGTEAVIAYASRSLSKAESHYPAHMLEFLALKWAVVKKFHEYLYGLTFDIHMNNNLLAYVLTTAKLDAASHCWVTSLANYNFRLHYRAGKAKKDADALSRVSWPECMPDSASTHIKVTAAAVQEAALQGPASSIEAYSSDLHILDVVCPRDGKGCSQTLHRNYLLPISPNLEQSEMDKPVAGVGNDTSLTPAPPVNDAPAGAELSGMVTSSAAGSTPEIVQIDLLPFSTALKPPGNQLPLRYWDMVK